MYCHIGINNIFFCSISFVIMYIVFVIISPHELGSYDRPYILVIIGFSFDKTTVLSNDITIICWTDRNKRKKKRNLIL